MASISGSVTLAGDPVDWIACAFDADTHAFAGSAAVADDAYEITGLTAGKAYMVVCRPKSGPAWAVGYSVDEGDFVIPTDTETVPYIYKATDSAPSDPYFSSVQLLLPCDGDDESQSFVDVAGHTVTANGNVKLDTAAAKWGSTGALFDGTTDYLAVTDSDDFTLDGDFTFECWVKWLSTSETKSPVFEMNTGISNNKLIIYKLGGNKLCMSYATTNRITDTNTYTDTNWHYVALKRESGVVSLWLDGNSIGTYTISGSMNTLDMRLGSWQVSGYYLDGYMDDIRLTVGVARDVSSVPIAAFPVGNSTVGAEEPIWPTTLSETVVDGDVTWTNMGRMVQPLIQGPLIAADPA